MYNTIIPTYEIIAKNLENEIDSLDGEYGKLKTELAKTREELRKEIDNVVNKSQQWQKKIMRSKKCIEIFWRHIYGLR